MAWPYNLNDSVATVLAQICCYNNELPQGAPTSPIISNMICAKMDSQLLGLAKKHQCFYTRYADDITFSTYTSTFPIALARKSSAGQVEIGRKLNQIIVDNGFQINNSKVRLQTREYRQEVTGLTVNKIPNVRRKYTRQIRAMLHAWEKYGLEAAENEFRYEHDKKHRGPYKNEVSFKQVVKGKIEFLGMVRGRDNPFYLRFCKQLKRLAPELVNLIFEEESPEKLEEIKALRKQLETHYKNLHDWQQKEAMYGLDCPPYIKRYIEYEQEEIEKKDKLLRELIAQN
jgi:RNA-directed DNA polymerase